MSLIFQKYTPSKSLRPFIKEYVIIESNIDLINRVLPGTSLTIAFRFRGQLNYMSENDPANLPASFISGLRKSPRLINYLKGTAAIIVIFEETGANAFFKGPINELFGDTVSLDNFIHYQKITIVEERLSEARINSLRIEIIEQFLLSMINFKPTDKLIAVSIQKIYTLKGIVEIKTLADELHLSLDAFEKRFRKIVGTTPKHFSSIVRMKMFIDNIEQTDSLTEAALAAGFFDQPHFNKQFKVFTGQSPSDFFRIPPLW